MSSFLFAAGERHNSLGVGFENMIKKDMGPFLKKGPFPVVFVTFITILVCCLDLVMFNYFFFLFFLQKFSSPHFRVGV